VKVKPKPTSPFYRGEIVGGECRVYDSTGAALPPRLDLWKHSPAGFAWGYGGSGPAQLALAILADHLGDDKAAVDLHQRFKFKVIAALEQDIGWTLTRGQIQTAIRAIREGE
jgi:hypothetical protein